jgi:predicted SnoaL-like aldol condensation-catalyzing enzyme
LFEHFVAAASVVPARADAPRVEANKALVRRYFEMWNTGDGAVADLVVGPTYLDHAHPEVIGPGALRSLVPRFHAADPEGRMKIEFAAADAELVAVRNTISRTIDGQAVESEGIALFRVAEGKLAEQWSFYPQTESQRSPLAARAAIDAWLSFRA